MTSILAKWPLVKIFCCLAAAVLVMLGGIIKLIPRYGEILTGLVLTARSRIIVFKQELHVCLVTDGSWRWTKPFSISQAGIQAIDIPVGRHMASLIIRVTQIGGLQKQV